MKYLKYLLAVIVLWFASWAGYSQNSDYLDIAKKHIQSGNIEKAEAAYNVYKELTGRTDKEVEKAIQGFSGTSGSNYTETVFGINMQMVYVEGGEFMMGCTSEQGSDCFSDEKNVRRVSVNSFYIGKFEVTQGQWEKVMGTSVYQQRDKGNWQGVYGVGSDYPMYYVSWEEATAFCEELSRRTGKRYRLPTEAEWEYAARDGNKNGGGKYSGSASVDMVAWYKGNSSNTHQVGTRRDNLLGIHDMSGNVWEWCKDWYGAYYSFSDTRNPQGPSGGFNRVARGGSWGNNAALCRVSARYGVTPGYRSYNVGFRVVCDF